VQLLLFTSSFCEPCRQTRAILAEAERLVPAATVRELDVASHADEAESLAVRMTPTVVVQDGNGTEVFRAEGVPTLAQVLVAAAKAI
jgi:thiol-disulfide isomerase/thioredoxin